MTAVATVTLRPQYTPLPHLDSLHNHGHSPCVGSGAAAAVGGGPATTADSPSQRLCCPAAPACLPRSDPRPAASKTRDASDVVFRDPAATALLLLLKPPPRPPHPTASAAQQRTATESGRRSGCLCAAAHSQRACMHAAAILYTTCRMGLMTPPTAQAGTMRPHTPRPPSHCSTACDSPSVQRTFPCRRLPGLSAPCKVRLLTSACPYSS